MWQTSGTSPWARTGLHLLSSQYRSLIFVLLSAFDSVGHAILALPLTEKFSGEMHIAFSKPVFVLTAAFHWNSLQELAFLKVTLFTLPLQRCKLKDSHTRMILVRTLNCPIYNLWFAGRSRWARCFPRHTHGLTNFNHSLGVNTIATILWRIEHFGRRMFDYYEGLKTDVLNVARFY